MFYRMGSNLDQERIDRTEELIVTETYTSFNHSNTNYIVTVLTTLFYICICIYIYIYIILTKTCPLDITTHICLL